MKTSLSLRLKYTCWVASDEVQPLLGHFHPDDALSRQVTVDGEELATNGVVVDDLIDSRP